MARKECVQRALEKSGGFVSAKKNIVIQYQGRELNEAFIMQRVMQKVQAQGIDDSEIELVDIYIKPEENTVFYVVNKDMSGKIEL